MIAMKNPPHPGKVLDELYLKPYGIGVRRLESKLMLTRGRISRIVRGRDPVTVEIARLLGHVFKTSTEYWLNMQHAWDLDRAREKVDLSRIGPLELAV